MTNLVQLLLNQFLLLKPLNRLKLFNHLLARFPSQVGILEILHRRLIHVHVAKSLRKLFSVVACIHEASMAGLLTLTTILHLDVLVLVGAVLIRRWLIWAL